MTRPMSSASDIPTGRHAPDTGTPSGTCKWGLLGKDHERSAGIEYVGHGGKVGRPGCTGTLRRTQRSCRVMALWAGHRAGHVGFAADPSGVGQTLYRLLGLDRLLTEQVDRIGGLGASPTTPLALRSDVRSRLKMLVAGVCMSALTWSRVRARVRRFRSQRRQTGGRMIASRPRPSATLRGSLTSTREG